MQYSGYIRIFADEQSYGRKRCFYDALACLSTDGK